MKWLFQFGFTLATGQRKMPTAYFGRNNRHGDHDT
jgi:hypothetical protein